MANAALGTLVGTVDTDTPDAGTTCMYQVAHSSENAAAIAPLGVQPASSSRSGQLVMADGTCP